MEREKEQIEERERLKKLREDRINDLISLQKSPNKEEGLLESPRRKRDPIFDTISREKRIELEEKGRVVFRVGKYNPKFKTRLKLNKNWI